MRLIWDQPGLASTVREKVSAVYDEPKTILHHEGQRFAFIDFYPITDKSRTAAMREPLDGNGGKLLVVECGRNTFVPVQKIPRTQMWTRNLSEILQTPLNEFSNKKLKDLAKTKEIQGKEYLKGSLPKESLIPPESQATRFYASDISRRTEGKQDGFMIIEVPSGQETISPAKLDSHYQRGLTNKELLSEKGNPMPHKLDIYGGSAYKIACMKLICEKSRLPFRFALTGSTSGHPSLRSRQEAGFFADKEYFETVKQSIDTKSQFRKTKIGKLLNAFSSSANEEEKNLMEFPAGEKACAQMNDMYTPKRKHPEPVFSM